MAIVGTAGPTDIETRAIVTVIGAVPLIDPEVAVIVAEPFDFPVASPLLAMVAMAELDTLHVTDPLMSWVLPSPYVPVAVN